MRILAIETSTMLGGAAVMDSGAGLLAEVRVNVKAAHSERLMSEVDYVLAQASCAVQDMDALAVATGPGSFTGLRIGLSTVKGLAFATGLPVVAVPTLEAFASCFPYSACPVCPLLDARKKEVYAALFAYEEGALKKLMPETAIKASELAVRLSGHGAVLFTGQGADIYREDITRVMGDRAVFAPAHLMAPSPAAVGWLGLGKALGGEFSDPAALSPFYIRKSEAETKAR